MIFREGIIVKSLILGIVALLILAWHVPEVSAQVRPTPELRIALQQFLDAVANDDMGRIHALSTKSGYQLIVRALNNHKEASKMLKVIGAEYAASRVRWMKVTDTFARGKVKFVFVDLIVQRGRWKFNNATMQ